MAVVLSGTHLQLGLPVAIKLLRPEGRAYPEVVERFLREGRAAARLRSEHVVRVFDVGAGAYGPFLVMEFLEGRDLETVLREDGPLSVECAIDYVLQACEAIAEAHAAGVIHRDLKPANLFLATRADQSSCVKVLDFGISKLTREMSQRSSRGTDPSLFMGSPPYVSPEQAKSPRDVDARTDIWALGATLHELLAGEPPFGLGPGPAILIRAATRRSTPLSTLRADVPPELDEAIGRCLAVDVRDRFGSVTELAGAIAESGSANARASARRIGRISSVPNGWEIPARVRSARGQAPVCALDLVDPYPTQRAIGAPARWGGYVTAIAIVGFTFAYVVWRCDAAFVAETRAAADLVHVRDDGAAFVARAPSRGREGVAGAPLTPGGSRAPRDDGDVEDAAPHSRTDASPDADSVPDAAFPSPPIPLSVEASRDESDHDGDPATRARKLLRAPGNWAPGPSASKRLRRAPAEPVGGATPALREAVP
jgi:hypothetical protein